MWGELLIIVNREYRVNSRVGQRARTGKLKAPPVTPNEARPLYPWQITGFFQLGSSIRLSHSHRTCGTSRDTTA